MNNFRIRNQRQAQQPPQIITQTVTETVVVKEKLAHCQVCQEYRGNLKEYAGQTVCGTCRQKLEGKRLQKAQQSFFDDQQPLFQM